MLIVDRDVLRIERDGRAEIRTRTRRCCEWEIERERDVHQMGSQTLQGPPTPLPEWYFALDSTKTVYNAG